MKRNLFLLVALFGVAGLALTISAKTPDGQTPAEEDVCAGLSGAAYGLCNAYCEAQDCDVHDRPSCARLRRNFERLTGSPIFPCDARCGDGVVNQEGEECDDGNDATCDGCSPECTLEVCGDGVLCRELGEECEPGDTCENGLACTDDCTCPCPPIDTIIDMDGTASPTAGGPGSQQVRCGDPIIALNATGNEAGLDTLNTAYPPFGGFPHAWDFGGDDLHLEDPFPDSDGGATTCPTAIRDGSYQLDRDCVVLDLDGSLFDQQPVACDNACDPRLSFHDLNGNGIYNDGEDIIVDTNANGRFDCDCAPACPCGVTCTTEDGEVGACRDPNEDGVCECIADPPACVCGATCTTEDGEVGACRDPNEDGVCECIADPPACVCGATCTTEDGEIGACRDPDGDETCECVPNPVDECATDVPCSIAHACTSESGCQGNCFFTASGPTRCFSLDFTLCGTFPTCVSDSDCAPGFACSNTCCGLECSPLCGTPSPLSVPAEGSGVRRPTLSGD